MINNKIITNSSKGFTLLELIIVFTVIAILSSIGIASFVGYSRSQTVQTAAYDLQNTLSLAKSKAMSQVKPTVCASTAALLGYRVDLDTGNGTYKILVICSDGQFNPLSGNNETTLPTAVSFDTNKTDTFSVFFPVITSGVIGSGEIVLKGFSDEKYSRWLCITANGVVKVSAVAHCL